MLTCHVVGDYRIFYINYSIIQIPLSIRVENNRKMDLNSNEEPTVDEDILAAVDNPYQNRSRVHSPSMSSDRILMERDYGVMLDSHGRLPLSSRIVSDELISRVPQS